MADGWMDGQGSFHVAAGALALIVYAATGEARHAEELSLALCLHSSSASSPLLIVVAIVLFSACNNHCRSHAVCGYLHCFFAHKYAVALRASLPNKDHSRSFPLPDCCCAAAPPSYHSPSHDTRNTTHYISCLLADSGYATVNTNAWTALDFYLLACIFPSFFYPSGQPCRRARLTWTRRSQRRAA